MYKYLLDENKNQFYPLIDNKSIINANTVNDVQIEELFNPTVEDILIEDEYRFSVGQYPNAFIGVECIPERAGKQAYLDVTTSNPDCCSVSYIDGSTIFLNTDRRGESTITITETNSGISKEVRVLIQGIPSLYVNSSEPLYTSVDVLQESFDEAIYRVEAWSNDPGYQFSHWSDGNTENPREITIYEDTELTAYYKPVLCKVEVRSSNNDWGTVRGGGSVRYGGNLIIKAIPNSGYRFVQWSDGNTNSEREMWASGDVVYEAVFEELNPNQVIYYTSNGRVVTHPYSYNFGANLVDNIYTNGQGMMIFDGDVTNIGYQAFYSDNRLTSVTIPNSVTSIGDQAFSKCSMLRSITIPNSVTYIGYNTFYQSKSLETITCTATIPPTLGAYNDVSSVYAVYVPAESVEAYKTATNWSYYSSKIQPIPS